MAAFWTSFHSLSSPTLGISQREGFYLPDPCELNFANTILLSNAAISLGNAFISLEISLQLLECLGFYLSLILRWAGNEFSMFCVLQIWNYDSRLMVYERKRKG